MPPLHNLSSPAAPGAPRCSLPPAPARPYLHPACPCAQAPARPRARPHLHQDAAAVNPHHVAHHRHLLLHALPQPLPGHLRGAVGAHAKGSVGASSGPAAGQRPVCVRAPPGFGSPALRARHPPVTVALNTLECPLCPPPQMRAHCAQSPAAVAHTCSCRRLSESISSPLFSSRSTTNSRMASAPSTSVGCRRGGRGRGSRCESRAGGARCGRG